MFGIGAEELIVIGLLFLVIFGPGKLPQMARELGRFANQARNAMEEFKSDITFAGNGEQKPHEEEPRGRNREQQGEAPGEEDQGSERDEMART